MNSFWRYECVIGGHLYKPGEIQVDGIERKLLLHSDLEGKLIYYYEITKYSQG